jgi:hypothetical protein
MHAFMSRAQEGLTLAALEREMGAATYRPGFLPHVAELVADASGGAWIRLAAGVPGMSEWLAYDAAGEPAGRVRIPEGVRILLVEGDTLWGVETDELDVNYIVRYRLGPGE